MFMPSAEICDACNTINMGAARTCKCCSHKLPAFYMEADPKAEAKRTSPRSGIAPEWAWAVDFAAFGLVINSLVIVTRFIPIP